MLECLELGEIELKFIVILNFLKEEDAFVGILGDFLPTRLWEVHHVVGCSHQNEGIL